MILTPHFRLSELTGTTTGLPNEPTPDVVASLRVLCAAVLEPLRTRTGPLRVTSGYRSPAVNAAVRGSPTSLHRTGEAADVVPLATTREDAWEHLVALVRYGALPVDEAIVYETTGHLHLAYTTTRPPRYRLLVSVRGTHQRYVAWEAYRRNSTLPPVR